MSVVSSVEQEKEVNVGVVSSEKSSSDVVASEKLSSVVSKAGEANRGENTSEASAKERREYMAL